MRIQNLLLIAIAIGCSVAASVARADLVVSQWALGSVVDDPNNNTDQDRQFFLVVHNPFNASHTAVAGSSSAQTAYNMSWSGDSAAFHISANHYMAQLDGRVSTGGQIYFTPMVDSTLTLAARYDYDWPTSVIGQSGLNVLIGDFTAQENIYNEGVSGGNVGFDPPHGTLTLPTTTLSLFAGHDYVINYGALTDQFNAGPPGTHGESAGEMHFTITPVPEPATAAFLGALLLLRRQ